MKNRILIVTGLVCSISGLSHPAMAAPSARANFVPASSAELSDILEHNKIADKRIDDSLELSKSGDALAQEAVLLANQGLRKPIAAALPTIDWQATREISDSSTLAKSGDAAAVAGVWDQAKQCYLQALEKWKENGDANYGMAQCCHAAGDSAGELRYYRAFTYRGEPSESSFLTCDTTRLLIYAQALDKGGQTAEATTIYNHTASLLKYMDDKPSSVYLLPLFGTEPGQVAYTSARLQALVHVGLGVDSLYTQELKRSERLAHLREAVRLYPDSPVVYAYLEYQLRMTGDSAGAKAALNRANSLGLARVSALLDAQTAEMQAQKAPGR